MLLEGRSRRNRSFGLLLTSGRRKTCQMSDFVLEGQGRRPSPAGESAAAEEPAAATDRGNAVGRTPYISGPNVQALTLK